MAEAGEKYSLFSVFGAAIEWVIVSDCGSHSCADWWVLQHWHRGCARQDGNLFVRPSWKLKHPQCFTLNGEHGFELVIFYCLVHRSHLHTFGRFLRSPNPILHWNQEIETERRKAGFSVPLGSQVKVTHTPQEVSVTLTLGTSGDSACSCQCKKNFSRAQICCIKNEGWWQDQLKKDPLISWNTSSISRSFIETVSDHDPVLLLWNLLWLTKLWCKRTSKPKSLPGNAWQLQLLLKLT